MQTERLTFHTFGSPLNFLNFLLSIIDSRMPEAIVGDLDSARASVLSHYQSNVSDSRICVTLFICLGCENCKERGSGFHGSG